MHQFAFRALLLLSSWIYGGLGGYAQPSASEHPALGTLGPLRTCYDVTHYELEIKVAPKLERIAGSNRIRLRAREDFDQLQLDLNSLFQLARIVYEGRSLPYTREQRAVLVQFPRTVKAGSSVELVVYFGGTPPRSAEAGPQGGFVWDRGPQGHRWMGISSAQLSPSDWWPLKDHPSDLPDSLRLSLICPTPLMGISDGKFLGQQRLPGNFVQYTWNYPFPLPPEAVQFTVGAYEPAQDVFKDVEGNFHHINFYLFANEGKEARTHLQQFKDMLRVYEHFLGPYPFWASGLNIMQTKGTPFGHGGQLTFSRPFDANEFGFNDQLLHELGHAWFGKLISVSDPAEAWIREGFATYLEALYVEHRSTYANSLAYLKRKRTELPARPLMGPLRVNHRPAAPEALGNKGAWMLHSLRRMVDQDSIWFSALRTFPQLYAHRVVSTQDVIEFFNQQCSLDLTSVFDHYLSQAELPVFTYRIKRTGLKMGLEYKWNSPVEDFRLPVFVLVEGERFRLDPGGEWQTFNEKNIDADQFRILETEGLFDIEEIK